MARGKKKESALTPEEKLMQALVPVEEQPYKVPENWCWSRLGSIVVNHDAKRVPLSTAQRSKLNKIYNYYGASGVIDKVDNYIFDEELLLIGEDGANLLSRSTDIAFLANGKYWVNNHAHVLDAQEITTNQFLCNYINHIDLSPFVTGSAQPKLTQEKLNSIPIPLPPKSEQQCIVDRIEYLFAKLDESKEKAQSVLDSFETRKAAILHKAFTGELTAKWRAEHGVELDNWDQGCLSNFCEVNPKKAATKDLPDDFEVSFVPMTALSDILGEITDPQVRKLKEVRTGFTNFSEGDVVFAKITPCMENGKSAVVGPLVNDLGFGTTEFYVLRCSKMLFNRYLYHLVRSRTFRAEAKAVMTGAVGQQRVPKSFLEDYPLTIPSVPEQVEIVRILDSLFTKEQQAKEAAEAVLEKIDLLKKSILARAFRGELGTNDPAEESAIGLLKVVLNTEKKVSPRQKAKSLPRELKRELRSNLEEKIVKLFFQKDTVDISMEEIMLVSSQTFEVIESLRELERRNILKKQNSGHYKLMR